MEFQETPQRELDILRAAVGRLRAFLPRAWTVETTMSGQERAADALLRVRAPDGTELTALMDVKRLVATRDVFTLLERLRRGIGAEGQPQIPVVVARYLSPATRDKIAELGAGYLDATGNLYLSAESPALLIRGQGAEKDPWRGPGRPRGTLKGPPAARVVRALIDFAPPYTVPELAARAGASIGATYRVVELLEELQLLSRENRGPITTVAWRAVLERWSRDYEFGTSNVVARFLEPRGLPALMERLRNRDDTDYVITGSLAAQSVAPYAASRLAVLYVQDIEAAADAIELRAATTGANVVLAVGDYDVVFERARTLDGLKYAALSQVAVDLLNGPGRNTSEALALLDWMERNESNWRR
ncbi:MAG: hypothetical protein C0516_00330 [Gemmatimonas sp.]|nr:hypothetical protein [Gemmatimonas sp.]